MSRRRPAAIPPSTPCLRCRQSGSTIRAVVLSETHFPSSGIQSAGVAPLPPCFRKFVDGTVKTVAVFPSVCTLPIVTTIARCPYARAIFTTAGGKVAKSARRCALGPSRWYHVLVIPMTDCSLSFLSCPRVCLLDVCCLLGLTLRPSAPVCCCHQDSWTRGRLAFEQEAVRVTTSHSPRFVLHVMACAH